MTEEQKTKNHYEMLNNSSNKALVNLIKMQDNKIEELEKENAELKSGCGMCYRKDKELLIKAKEIIKKIENVFFIAEKTN